MARQSSVPTTMHGIYKLVWEIFANNLPCSLNQDGETTSCLPNHIRTQPTSTPTTTLSQYKPGWQGNLLSPQPYKDTARVYLTSSVIPDVETTSCPHNHIQLPRLACDIYITLTSILCHKFIAHPIYSSNYFWLVLKCTILIYNLVWLI